MIHLVYGQRLDRLLEVWSDRIGSRPLEGFEGLTVLTANPRVGRWTRTWWARHRGIAARWALRSLQGYLDERVRAALGRRLPTVRVLELSFLDRLFGGETLPVEIVRYLDRSQHAAEVDRRRAQLARRLARDLEARAVGRGAPSSEWPRDVVRWAETILEDPALISWREAFADPEALGLPPRLSLVDAFEPTPALVGALARIAQTRELWILAVNPCAEFWEDLPIRRAADALPSRSTPLLPGVESTPGENPLLSAWGASGRRRMAELNRLSECDFVAAFAPPSGETLLERVQADVSFRRAPSPGAAGDGTIAIATARSVRHEAERVAGRIVWLLDHDPDLRLNDVLVALPSRDAPEIRTALHVAFARHHGIPSRDLDLPWAEGGRIVAAFRELCRLADDDFSARRVGRLLEQPHVAFDGDDDERALARTWIERLRIVSGRDHGAHAGSYIDRDVLNWEQGLRRLALGLAYSDGDRPIRDEETYVPLGASSAETVGRFVRWARSLLRDFGPLARRSRPLAAWSERLRALVLEHVRPITEADEREKGALLDAIEALGRSPGAAALPFSIVRALLDDHLDARRRDEPGALHRGVVIAPLASSHNLPFTACFVVGLTEDAFPSARSDPTLESGDRFDFLTRLMNTTRYFWASAPRSEDEGHPPSPVLLELRDVLTRGYGVAPTELDVPTVPSPAERRVEWALEGGVVPPRPPLPPTGPRPRDLRITRWSLSELLLRPDRAWRRTVLDVRPPERRDPEDEVFRIPIRVVEEIAREVLEAWPDVDPEGLGPTLEAALEDRQSTAPIPVGLYGRAEAARLAATLRRWLDTLWAEGAPASPPFPRPELERWTRPAGGWVEVTGRPPLTLGGTTHVLLHGGRQTPPDRALAQAFVEHVLLNRERPTATTALALDASGHCVRHELRPLSPDDATSWLEDACDDLWTEDHHVNFPFKVAREVLAARRAGREEELGSILARARSLDPDAEAEGREPPPFDRALAWATRRFDLLERSLIR